jgi:predicted nucleic acid-binding protein
MILVDTSVWVDHFNGHDSREARLLVRAIEEDEPITVPGLVMTELLLGVRSDTRGAQLVDLMSAFDCGPEPLWDDYIAAAGIFRQCRVQGLTIRSTIDCVIAQVCLRAELVLLSKDADFRRIAAVFPLKLAASSN